MDQIAVIDALGRLVDSSLVRSREIGDIRRFSMLETIREFAVEMLDATENLDEVSERHVRVMTGLASAMAAELMRGRIESRLVAGGEHGRCRTCSQPCTGAGTMDGTKSDFAWLRRSRPSGCSKAGGRGDAVLEHALAGSPGRSGDDSRPSATSSRYAAPAAGKR